VPVPQGPAIKSGVISRLPSNFQTSWGVLNDFLTDLCGDISTAWQEWELGLLAGLNNVVGLGIGAWAGVGQGGKLTETVPFNVVHTWPNNDPSGYWDTFKAAITAELKEEFNMFATSYVFGSVPYLGASTATPLSPGVFTATNTPGTVAADQASANDPMGFANGVRGRLPSQWAQNPNPLNQFLGAVEGSINEQFNLWASAALVSGDTVIGVASPGTGAGAGVSIGTGVVT
jgi:hypothetical protein